MSEEETKDRIRVNTGISVKGVITWECTVEKFNSNKEAVLAEIDALVAELKKRYPVKEV